MIDEEETFKRFGYYSTDLKPKSDKKIVAVCNNCGKVRIVQKKAYRDLCHLCSLKTDEHRRKLSESITETLKDPEVRKKISNSAIKRWKDPEERKKQRENAIKRWEDPEFHEKISEKVIEQWKNPGYRKKVSEKARESAIKRWEDLEEREKMSERVSGENHPNWHGGISFGKYCPRFNNAKKREIREKYHNCDYISGLPDSICNNSKKLDVHHVDYNKKQGCEDHEWRLIPLSHVNHAKTNYNRSFWNRLFTYSLQYDEEYYKEEDKDFDTFRTLKNKKVKL